LQNWGNAGSHLHVHLPAIHAYAYTHSHRDSNCDRETKSHSESAYDTEAAPDSAAKAVSFNRSICRLSAVRGPDK